jgi:hypothetical protein
VKNNPNKNKITLSFMDAENISALLLICTLFDLHLGQGDQLSVMVSTPFVHNYAL